MKPAMALRRRVALATTLAGLTLSLLLAAAVAWLAHDYEYVFATEILQGQADDYGLRLANALPANLPDTHRLRGYRIDDPALPAAYRQYPVGVSEDENDEDLHVGVFDTSAGRLVFVIDLGDIETAERHLHLFLVGMVLFGTALSGWLGWLLSGTALRPLRTLAEGVEALPAAPQETRLAEGMSADDLGRLAAAIDAYQARLLAADAREQAFFADASHELRTPLAVIQGVSEVLLDEPPEQPAARARLQRLDRGVREMRELLEAMLESARRKPVRPEQADVAALLGEAAGIAVAGKPGIAIEIAAAGTRELPQREALLLVAGLARRLATPHASGVLRMQAQVDRLLIRMAPSDGVATDAIRHARADTVTGSALLDRLATRLGWRVRFDSNAQVTVLFEPAAGVDAGSDRA